MTETEKRPENTNDNSITCYTMQCHRLSIETVAFCILMMLKKPWFTCARQAQSALP